MSLALGAAPTPPNASCHRRAALKQPRCACCPPARPPAGLYSERVGALNVVLADAGAADRVLSQLKRIARAIYSNPPVHGARIVAEVVGSEELFGQWREEMEMMAGRIKVRRRLQRQHCCCGCSRSSHIFMSLHVGCTPATPAPLLLMGPLCIPLSAPAAPLPLLESLQGVRQALHGHLTALHPEKDWSFVLSQIGMFSFTGLNPAQVGGLGRREGAPLLTSQGWLLGWLAVWLAG